MTDPHVVRFWSKVDCREDDACWPWTGARGYGPDSGYGYAQWHGRSIGAHRVAALVAGKTAGSGQVIDHLCRNRLCVNPAHLEVVSPKENTLRGEGPTALNARKTECVRGHPFSGRNLIRRPNGQRDCRACKEMRRLRRRARSHQETSNDG